MIKRDFKLLSIALFIFVVLPLLGRPTGPEPKPLPRIHFKLKSDIDVHKLQPKQEAKICWSFQRWCVYGHWGCFEPEIPNRCEGEGWGGGGGSAF